MKIRNILSLLTLFTVVVNAQTGSINNTLGTGGSFIVKDGTDSYLRVDQSTGNAIVLRNFGLGTDSISSLTSGVITKGGKRFLHNYAPNGSEFNNLFIGLDAGNFTMGGGTISFESSYNVGVGSNSLSSITTGYSNTALGSRSLLSNTTGYDNTAIGYCPLYSNTTGMFNTAVGNYALFNNNGVNNSAFGLQSLYLNYSGFENSAFGSYSLYSNNSGYQNSAFGNRALYSNIIGIENSAFGYEALTNTVSSYNSAFGNKSLKSNSIGEANSAFGIGSLLNNTSGSNNTAVGNIAGSGITTGNNNIAIGYDAQVPNGTASNQVQIGNNSISFAGIHVAWSLTSDRRWKENIQPIDLGLNFISKLNPVSYTRKNDKCEKVEYGLIAQELEEVLKSERVENAGMLTITDDGYYELRYNDLLAPMIKAIQELKQQNEDLVLFNKQLAEQNESLRKEIKLSISEQIEDKIKSLLTQVSESENSSLNIALEKSFIISTGGK